MRGLISVTEGVHDIPARVKAIDSRYEICYNVIHSRFELHAIGFRPSLQLVLPYKQLDKRTVDYVLATRIDRQERAVREMDVYNERLISKRADAVLDEAGYKMSSIIRYLNRGGIDIPSIEEI